MEQIQLWPAGALGYFEVSWLTSVDGEPLSLQPADWVETLPIGWHIRLQRKGIWVVERDRPDRDSVVVGVLGATPARTAWWWSRWLTDRGEHSPLPAPERDVPHGVTVLADWTSVNAEVKARHQVWSHHGWSVDRLRHEASRYWQASGWRRDPRWQKFDEVQQWQRGPIVRRVHFQSHGLGSAGLLIDEEVGHESTTQ